MRLYVLAILSISAIIGIVVTFDFDFSFAFHRPDSGYTIRDGQMYTNNGTDNILDPLLVQPIRNDTTAFANTPAPQPMNGTTQNLTSSSSPSSDIISHLNLARQAVELGNPGTILKELDFLQQQLYFITKNATTSDFSTMSNLSSTESEELNATQNQPEDVEEEVPVEEQRPRSSATRDDTPQRTRSYQ